MSELSLPRELTRLLSAGAWPLSEPEANRQNLDAPPIPTALVESLVPGESRLYLLPPPFRTIAQRCSASGSERDFWHEFGDLTQIDPELALVIADFGLGSDSVIVLDYRSPESPPLLRLVWADGASKPTWALFFATFTAFASAFNLEHSSWR